MADLERAVAALDGLAGPENLTTPADDTGWISVHIPSDRIAEVNRTLAGAGIWAVGLESGNDLEVLFLELTGGEPAASGEGTFFGIAGAEAGNSPSKGRLS
jgi:hypothetical protein